MRINNRERELWVLNDESLYRWYKSSRCTLRKFIRQNKEEIDAVIRNVTGN